MPPRELYGQRAPLFERLSARDTPLVLDAPALAESIRGALVRLLGSRADRSVASYLAGPRLVTSYGVPGTVDFTAVSLSDRQLMARCLEAAIASYEPRLSGVSIAIEPTRDRLRPLEARLTATVTLMGYQRAVVFLLNGRAVTLAGEG
ncbi:MAG: type VI secretion system baseplate subunit TssE [Oceanibaculum nanhaiense]|uniref:type VI secretion system baseplate subunit TssE n=1 Tax=Oceanibaculum nanhaiense TaxID=1909734 RepID=UPI0025A425D1|nr:type VI secretion system baseplate subunit TssE [Oceanibaculum nanhaiense]MDM7947450.1 type VI secretion system baseplate subunit TssE [Oceanibaculum nanhaiense]